MIHDRVCETNVFQRYTSLLCVAATASFRDIFSLLVFYEVYRTHDKRSLRETNFFLSRSRVKRHAWFFFFSLSEPLIPQIPWYKVCIAVMDALVNYHTHTASLR